MKRETKKYLFDINTSIDSMCEYLGAKQNFFEYQKNKLLRRGREITGEATNRILKIALEFNLANARQIVDT
ncbi:MAG: hypothetical protein QM786_15610 [Breznakibacter sp.]